MTYVSCWLDELFEDEIVTDIEQRFNALLDHPLVVRVIDGVRRVEVGLDEIDCLLRQRKGDLLEFEYCYIIKSAIQEYKKEMEGE